MNLGKAIKLCRVQSEMSQQELADLVGTSVSYISLLERNKRYIAITPLGRLAKAFNMPVFLFIYLAEQGDDIVKSLDISLREKLSHEVFRLLRESHVHVPDCTCDECFQRFDPKDYK